MTRSRRFFISLFVLALAALPAPFSLAAQPAEAPAGGSHGHEQARSAAGSMTGDLGISVRPLNPELRRHFGAPSEEGVLVATVVDGSPAARAGVAVGDVIVSVDGRKVASESGLRRAMHRRSGERIEVDLYRNGTARTLEVVVGERRHSHRHDHWDDDDWEDWAESWADWGAEWAEWGAEWGEWGTEFGERWADFGARMGERWADRGVEWGEAGAEIGERMAEAFAELDWDELDRALDESIRALDEIDWDAFGDELDLALEEVDAALDHALEQIEEAPQP